MASLYFRNNKEEKSKRFLMMNSKYYDLYPNNADDFSVRAKNLATKWGYCIDSSEEEFLEYE